MTALYVIVNGSLTKSQRIPQGAHATAEFMHEHGQEDDVINWVENDRTMVCLRTSEDRLKEITELSHKSSFFVDDDLNDMLTAVAIGPLTRERGLELFGDLPLA